MGGLFAWFAGLVWVCVFVGVTGCFVFYWMLVLLVLVWMLDFGLVVWVGYFDLLLLFVLGRWVFWLVMDYWFGGGLGDLRFALLQCCFLLFEVGVCLFGGFLVGCCVGLLGIVGWVLGI